MTSQLTAERFSSAREFSRAAEEFLVAREAENNLLLGITDDLIRGASFGDEPPYFGVVRRDGTVSAAVVRTPPFGVSVADTGDDEAIDLLAEDVQRVFQELPGAIGPIQPTERFVAKWESLTTQRRKVRANERIYRCGAVTRARSPRGEMRAFRESDRQCALQWMKLFISESKLPLRSEPQLLVGIDRHLSNPDGGIFFWEVDGEVVSMAGAGGRTPNGVRIGPVYTPPNERGKGYGTALVADLTTLMFDRGRTFCFLFTDLANPTSNSIYTRIGYAPVIDCTMYDLIPA
ncbi:MAG: GNAT family N-acetyltransferase [Gemmatimonadota bacterium]|nr:GNAT family N-acetyltransferase [Gemmatimonadota bacterium]